MDVANFFESKYMKVEERCGKGNRNSNGIFSDPTGFAIIEIHAGEAAGNLSILPIIMMINASQIIYII